MAAASDSSLIRLDGVRYSYGTVLALDGVDLALHPGKIHALVGEHGAGKSSLAMIIAGELAPRSGQVLFRGVPTQMSRSKAALRLGVKMIYQTILLNNHFSVAESIFYSNRIVNRGVWVHRRRMEAAAAELFERYGIRIKPTASVSSLNIAERTVVDIIRSLQTDTSLLIVDEGLDNLTAEYHRRITALLKERAEKGMAVLLITHKIEDIYDVADRVSIMRNGRVLATDDVRNIDKMSLLRLTYTQMNRGLERDAEGRDFHNLLKYNEAILQFLPINLVVVDDANRIELVNDYCKQYFGLAEQYYDTPLSNLLGADNIDVYGMLLEALSSREEKNFYHVKMVVCGREAVTNIKTLPIMEGNVLIGSIIILEDISEFEKLQDRLILSEKLASIGLLAAGVAHEINNPLEIIYNYLAYLRYNLSDPELLKAIDTVHNEMVAISGIVSNLVSFSDRSAADQEFVDLDGLIGETMRLLKFNAEYKSISMSFAPGLKGARARLNGNEFKQVLLNLFKNSFEAMPDGGRLVVSTKAESAPSARRAVIVVSDTGSGIAEEGIKNIFLPFYSTKKGQASNIGLGLSISYSIVQRYGGTISAANNPDRGCSFTVELPLEDR